MDSEVAGDAAPSEESAGDGGARSRVLRPDAIGQTLLAWLAAAPDRAWHGEILRIDDEDSADIEDVAQSMVPSLYAA